MNITAEQIKRILIKEYGWANMNLESNKFMIDELIKDTLKVVAGQVKLKKGISITKNIQHNETPRPYRTATKNAYRKRKRN